jgi:hypothetical protein
MPQTPKPKSKSKKAAAPKLVSITVVTKIEKGYHPGSVLVTSQLMHFKNGMLEGAELERRYTVDVS